MVFYFKRVEILVGELCCYGKKSEMFLFMPIARGNGLFAYFLAGKFYEVIGNDNLILQAKKDLTI